MQLLAQGMRRSGTTSVFDLFWDAPGTVCFYEPLAQMHRAAYGGGSGERDTDLFAPVRAARQRFVRQPGVEASFDDLNVGAPTNPAQEMEPEGPGALEDYLRFLGRQGAPDVVMKFTRLAAKVPVAHRALPEARLLHIVRDPRRVAVSHLFGRGHRRAHRYPTLDDFFEGRTRKLPWSATALSDALMERHPSKARVNPSDLERLFLLWGFNFRNTHRTGRQLFGDRYWLLRHEDLASNPRETVRRLFTWLGRDVPPAALQWSEARLTPPKAVFAPADSRWHHLVDRLGLEQEVIEAGYPEIAG